MKQQDKDKIIADLQAEIKTLKAIISLLPGNVYWKNSKGYYMGCNNNLAKVVNLNSPDEILGKKAPDLIGQKLGEQLAQIDNKVIENNQGKQIEEHGFNAMGKPAIYLSQKSVFYNYKEKSYCLLGVSFDITDRKLMEEKLRIAKKKAQAANQSKSRFLATVSHELRTPLTSILGFASFLERPNLAPEKRKEYITNITHSGSYLLSLINNLLDYNRLERGKFNLQNLPFNFEKTLQEIINMLSGAATLKKLKLFLDYDPKIPEQIIGDSRVVQQILVNLLGNAIKFTKKGHVALKVKCIESTVKSVKLEIIVEDTGIGIPINEQKSIFKRFHQVGNTYTRNTSLTGTGLGLAIVKKLVQLMKSQIKIKSTPQKGSTFYFVATFPKAFNKLQPSITNFKTIYFKKPTILLIEDDTLIQTVHKTMLDELGYQTDLAECAHTALKMLKKSYDILLVDIGLPDLPGIELIKLVRQPTHLNHVIPIIALTGYSEKAERQQCLSAGADEVVIKPITKPALSSLLGRYLSKKKIS